MPTFVNDDNGNVPKYYIELTLSANDGNGFQQLVNFDPSSYSSTYFASNLSNINFQDGAGNLLYSYQKTHAPTTSSTSVIYFVKLPNATTTTIYMVLVDTTLSSYSTTHTGVEPTYNSTYGQYDNGTSVFEEYYNFAGTSLPSNLSARGGLTVSVNNGLTITGVQANANVYSATTYTPSTIVFDLWTYRNTTNTSTGYFIDGASGFTADYLLGSANLSRDLVAQSYNGSSTNTSSAGSAIPLSPNLGVISIWQTSTDVYGSIDYGTPVSTAVNYTSTSNYSAVSIYVSGDYDLIQTWAIRLAPTNNSMPTITFGSITPAVTIFFIQNPYTILKYKPKLNQLNFYLAWDFSNGSASGSITLNALASLLASSSYNASATISSNALIIASSNYGSEVGIAISSSQKPTWFAYASSSISSASANIASSKYSASASINSLSENIASSTYDATSSINALSTVTSSVKYNAAMALNVLSTAIASSEYLATTSISSLSSIISGGKYFASLAIKIAGGNTQTFSGNVSFSISPMGSRIVTVIPPFIGLNPNALIGEKKITYTSYSLPPVTNLAYNASLQLKTLAAIISSSSSTATVGFSASISLVIHNPILIDWKMVI